MNAGDPLKTLSGLTGNNQLKWSCRSIFENPRSIFEALGLRVKMNLFPQTVGYKPLILHTRNMAHPLLDRNADTQPGVELPRKEEF
jgi:hypothetical protein